MAKHLSGKEICQKINRQKNMNKFVKLLTELEEYDLPNLVGKKVILRTSDYDLRIKNNEMSDMFIRWYNENKHKTHIVTESPSKGMYSLNSSDVFNFHFFDLLDPKTNKHFEHKRRKHEL